MNEARDFRYSDAKGARGFLVGDRRAAADLTAQKAFQDVKDLGFSRRSLFLLKALRGAAQKQQRPLRIVECFRGEPVFGFEPEASLRILPIQPDQLGAPASFFRGRPSHFDRNEVLERGEQKRAKSSLRPVNGG